METDFDSLLKTARDAIRQCEANVKRCKELCDGFQALAAYEFIGAQPGCTDEELRSAYHRKVANWHPDKFHAANIPTEMKEYATREMARVNEAYSILKVRRSGSETS